MKQGFFITFEGCEGSGKSTQAALLCELLKQKGFTVTHTREPGGTSVSEAVRRLLLDPKSRITPLAELFLYESARTQHMTEVILPALKAGHLVICDRFTDATIAYQGYGRGIDTGIIHKLNLTASCGIKPDLTIYLDIPVEKGLKKARSIKKDFLKACDRLEGEKLSFHKRVRKGYLETARLEPRRVKAIRTKPTIEQTRKEVAETVLKYLPESFKARLRKTVK